MLDGLQWLDDLMTSCNVQVYHLNAEGAWEDQGTGFAAITDKCIYCHAEEVASAVICCAS